MISSGCSAVEAPYALAATGGAAASGTAAAASAVSVVACSTADAANGRAPRPKAVAPSNVRPVPSMGDTFTERGKSPEIQKRCHAGNCISVSRVHQKPITVAEGCRCATRWKGAPTNGKVARPWRRIASCQGASDQRPRLRREIAVDGCSSRLIGVFGPMSRVSCRRDGGVVGFGQTRSHVISLRRTRNRLPRANSVKSCARFLASPR